MLISPDDLTSAFANLQRFREFFRELRNRILLVMNHHIDVVFDEALQALKVHDVLKPLVYQKSVVAISFCPRSHLSVIAFTPSNQRSHQN